MNINLRNILVNALVVTTLWSCASTTNQGTVGVKRSQFLLVSESQLESGANEAYSKLLGKAKEEDSLNTDPKMTARVRRIGEDLIQQVGVFRQDALNWDWQINVINSEQVNAWCMPGGKIGVYSGIIEELELTDDELAAIMGHEISHALREHSREQASRTMAAQLGLTAGAIAAGGGVTKGTMDMASMVAQVTFLLPNSRTAESEADLMGVELAARAGYDPRAAVSLWKKMESHGGARPPEFISTHPSPQNRISSLGEASQHVMPLYNQAITNPR